MPDSRVAKILLPVALLLPAVAAAVEPPRFFGDTRFGVYATEREARDETETSEEALKLRLRLGAEAQLSERWQARGRLAGRFTTEQDRSRFWLKAWAPTPTGLEDGDATIDELYLHYAEPGADWSLRMGRFQSKFALPGVASKSLDRNDSPNVDITWTEGIHWQYRFMDEWKSHLVLQRNVSSGSGQTARRPLTFDDDSSVITTFAALEAATPLGPLTQRLFAVTWMPETLAPDGISADRRQDYFAFTAKLFAEWPVGTSGMRAGLGGEAGYAPNTPTKAVVNAGGNGSADGRATQFSMNLFDFSPGHNIAFVYGSAGAGWLISPDFRNNDQLLEIRYQWKFAKNWSIETRLRRREESKTPAGTRQARIDDDFYFRFTGRF